MSFAICGFIPHGVIVFVGLLVIYNLALNRVVQRTQNKLSDMEATALGQDNEG